MRVHLSFLECDGLAVVCGRDFDLIVHSQYFANRIH